MKLSAEPFLKKPSHEYIPAPGCKTATYICAVVTQLVKHNIIIFTDPVEFIVDMYDTMENLIVGDPYEIKCEISTNLKINSGLINFTWIGPNNETIVTNNRTNVTTTTSIGKNHTSILQFLYLSENDHGLYTCLVTLLNVTDSAHLELEEASSK